MLKHEDLSIGNDVMGHYLGVGQPIDWSKPYILVVQHPVTTSYGSGMQQITETLDAVNRFSDLQKVVLWPNVDAGSDDVSKGIRHFRERHMDAPFYYYKNFSPEDYARVLNNAACCVGNSSSFLREGAFLGTPAVMVGDRQEGREHGPNVPTRRTTRKRSPNGSRGRLGTAGIRARRFSAAAMPARGLRTNSPASTCPPS